MPSTSGKTGMPANSGPLAVAIVRIGRIDIGGKTCGVYGNPSEIGGLNGIPREPTSVYRTPGFAGVSIRYGRNDGPRPRSVGIWICPGIADNIGTPSSDSTENGSLVQRQLGCVSTTGIGPSSTGHVVPSYCKHSSSSAP